MRVIMLNMNKNIYLTIILFLSFFIDAQLLADVFVEMGPSYKVINVIAAGYEPYYEVNDVDEIHQEDGSVVEYTEEKYGNYSFSADNFYENTNAQPAFGFFTRIGNHSKKFRKMELGGPYFFWGGIGYIGYGRANNWEEYTCNLGLEVGFEQKNYSLAFQMYGVGTSITSDNIEVNHFYVKEGSDKLYPSFDSVDHKFFGGVGYGVSLYSGKFFDKYKIFVSTNLVTISVQDAVLLANVNVSVGVLYTVF